MNKPDILCFVAAGPTGAGKSGFCARFRELPSWCVVSELPPAGFLGHSDPIVAGKAYEFQEAVIRTRAKYTRECPSPARLLFERSIKEDREVFLRLHQILGNLSPEEVSRLQRLANQVEQSLPTPTAVIFLTAEHEQLRSRLGGRAAPAWLIESLPAQLQLYREWLVGLELPVLLVDTTDLTQHEVTEIASWTARTADTVHRGEWSSLKYQDRFRWRASGQEAALMGSDSV